MALFKRADLKSQGLNDTQIEWIMTESNRALGDSYMLKSDLQPAIDAALKEAGKAVDITENPEYLKVASERDMLRAINGKEYESIKPKFREQVYNMIKREEGSDPVEKQLESIKKDYEEYWNPPTSETKPNAPQFGAGVSGSMPKGDTKPTFEGLWGFQKGD